MTTNFRVTHTTGIHALIVSAVSAESSQQLGEVHPGQTGEFYVYDGQSVLIEELQVVAQPAPADPVAVDSAIAAATETKTYEDGTTATGPGTLPDQSPDEQEDAERCVTHADEEITTGDVGILPEILSSSDAVAAAVEKYGEDAVVAAVSEALHDGDTAPE